jgi:drug/metabolite transporter (DMT)-like permease
MMKSEQSIGTIPACECGPDDACADAEAVPSALPRQVAWLQGIALAWMAVECACSLLAAARAHSVALLAFGSDSLIELLSAAVVLLQFVPRFPLRKKHAERAASVLLFLLAGCVVVIAALAYGTPKQTSWLGIAITAAALLAVPILAVEGRRTWRGEGCGCGD